LSLRTRLADLMAREHPEEAAAELERLPVERVARFVARQPPERVGDLLRRMDARFASRVAEQLGAPILASAVDTLDLDVAARLLRGLDPLVREAVLAAEPERGEALRRLLSFPEHTAGALLDPAVLALAQDVTARDALARIREDPEHARYNLYVVDRDGRLAGALNLRELLLARPRATLAELMVRDPHRIRADADRLAIVAHPGWHDVHALPVVDAEGVYLGAIRYRTLRALEDQLRPETDVGARTAEALGELFSTAAVDLLEAEAGGKPEDAAPERRP
jgi:magnesium transporter